MKPRRITINAGNDNPADRAQTVVRSGLIAVKRDAVARGTPAPRTRAEKGGLRWLFEI
jgi:hypothetical protein